MVSSNETPASCANGATLENDVFSFSTVDIELATDFANISKILVESEKSLSNPFTVATKVESTVSKSSPTPTANFVAWGIASIISLVFNPAEASSYILFEIFSRDTGATLPNSVVRLYNSPKLWEFPLATELVITKLLSICLWTFNELDINLPINPVTASTWEAT